MKIKIARMDKDTTLPSYKSTGASGMDICAAENAELIPGEIRMIHTDIYAEIPQGYEIQVRPRSGLALKHGLTVLNTPGTVDSDYRGEITVILINLGRETVTINRWDRIAQLVVTQVEQVNIEEVSYKELTETDRGTKGFGSTGVK